MVENLKDAIFIDGVNVAKCEFYIDDYKYSCDLSFINQAEPCNCENINTCYYKHWQRLKQENKELKEKIIELSEEKGHLIVENNTLKEANQSLSMLGTDLASANETVRKEFFRADKNKDMWREKVERYRSALEEIKVIADDTFKVCDDDCGNARKIKLIVDKINEVIPA